MTSSPGTVLEVFAGHVAEQPDHTAISLPEKELSYAALDEFSTHLAQRLLGESGVLSAPVALLMAHGASVIAAILGVLKAGKLYIPLDPSYPRARLVELLRAAAPEALLTDNVHEAAAQELALELGIPCVLNVETAGDAPDAKIALPQIIPSDAACVFYTSGSTGTPKGVLQNHGCIAHTALNYARAMGIAPTDRVVFATAASVGASSSVIFGALAGGATLFPFDLKAHGATALAREMRENRISVLHCVPSVLRTLLESLPADSGLPELRAIKIGGEVATKHDWELFQSAVSSGQVDKRCRLVNGLGITEAGGNVCFFPMTSGARLESVTIPVGSSAHGYDLSLRDENGLAPECGASGELVVTSDFLASGFWQRPDLTEAAFFATPDGRRSYRTGDLARFNADGVLEYLGRKDQQVKIRGQRVEIPAIEATMRALPFIADAAVILQESDGESEPQLIGCFVVKTDSSRPALAPIGDTTLSDVIRQTLGATLPAFMIPARFVQLEAWPLLPGGKLDRKALAEAVRRDEAGLSTGSSQMDDPLERRLQLIWKRVLKIKHVGANDSFFDLGGHSLAAAEITTALKAELDVEVPLTALAQFPTISQMAAALRTGKIVEGQRLLRLKENGGGAPFFCIPGAGGDAFAFLDLSNHLRKGQSLFALQPPGLDGISAFPKTIEGFADYYLETIRAHQPHGPYFLGGASMGGVIMFEVARRLQSQNEAVALLVLIDAKAVGYPRPRKWLGLQHPLASVWRILPVADKDSFAWRNILRGLREQRAYALAKREIESGKQRPYERRFLHLRLSSFLAKRSYRPGKFAGDMHLFAAKTQPSPRAFVPDEDLGWKPYIEGQIIRHVFVARHTELTREPVVRQVAASLSEVLERAQTDDAVPR